MLARISSINNARLQNTHISFIFLSLKSSSLSFKKTLSLKGVESSSCASSPESLLVDSSSETYLSCLTASSNFKLIGNTPLEDMLTKPNSTKTKLEIANTFASPKVIKPMTKSQDCEEQIEIIDLTLDDDEEESELVMSTSYTKRAWLHSSTVLGSI